MIQAAGEGQLDRVRYLLSSGAYVDATNSNRTTALHAAARAGKLEVVEALISNGADVNASDDHGFGPLHHAASFGHGGVLKTLVRAGANLAQRAFRRPGAMIFQIMENGDTPLHMASRQLMEDAVQVLIAAGSDINMHNDRSCTALHCAALVGANGILKMLISAGADLKARNRNCETALHEAVRSGSQDSVHSLISAGVEIDARAQCGPWSWQSALHYAAKSEQRDSVQIASQLLAAGANVNLESREGESPLGFAASRGSLDMVSLLISAGAEVGREAGRDALYLALKAGHMDVVSVLTWGGADVNYHEPLRSTLLELAVIGKEKGNVELLLVAGARTSSIALLSSAVGGDRVITNLLLVAGASADDRYLGRTVLSWVRDKPRAGFDTMSANKRQEMVNLLKGHSARY